MLVDIPEPRFVMVFFRSNLCSDMQCADMSGTFAHCCSQNRHLNVVVSGSLASSRMLPTELAASESEYAMSNPDALLVSRIPSCSYNSFALSPSESLSRNCAVALSTKSSTLVLVLCVVGENAGPVCHACRRPCRESIYAPAFSSSLLQHLWVVRYQTLAGTRKLYMFKKYLVKFANKIVTCRSMRDRYPKLEGKHLLKHIVLAGQRLRYTGT